MPALTLDIPVFDNKVKYLLDSFAEPQFATTVLSSTEASAKTELERVLPTMVGREVGLAKIERVVETKTLPRVLVVNREEALKLKNLLEIFLNQS